MQLDGARKRERVETALADLAASFRVLPMGEHAEALAARRALRLRAPDFTR